MPPYPIPPPPPPPVPPAPRGGEFLKGTDRRALPQKIRLLFACRKEIFQGKKRRKMGKNMLGVWSLWDHAWKREFFAKKDVFCCPFLSEKPSFANREKRQKCQGAALPTYRTLFVFRFFYLWGRGGNDVPNEWISGDMNESARRRPVTPLI